MQNAKVMQRAVFIALVFLTVSCGQELPRTYILHSQDPVPLDENTVSVTSIVVDAADSDIMFVGYCWSTEHPTINNDTTLYYFNDSSEFTGLAKNLVSGQEYHVRAYSVDTDGRLSYGNEVVFLNDFIPSFTVTRLDAIAEDYFDIYTEIDLRNKTITKYGHSWSTHPHPTVEDNKTEFSFSDSQGQELIFRSKLSGLTRLTKYFVRPYCLTEWGTIYGDQIVVNVPDRLITGKWQELALAELENSNYHYFSVQYENAIFFLTGNDGSYEANNSPDVEGFPEWYHKEVTRFDWISRTSTALKPFPGNLRVFGRGFLLDGKIYFGFGLKTYSPPVGNFDMWEYNISANNWRTRRPLPITTGSVVNCIAHAGFGWAIVDKGTSSELWQYDPSANRWTRKVANIPQPDASLFNVAIAALDDYIYFGVRGKIVRYRLSTNEWDVIRNKTSFCLFVLGSELYSIEWENRVYKWSGESDAWIEKAPLPSDRLLDHDDENRALSQEIVKYFDKETLVVGIRHVPRYAEYMADPFIWLSFSDQ